MTHTTVRAREKDELARFLGWFSVALGTAQAAAPRAMSTLVGAHGDGAAPVVMRAVGVREILQGLGILARPRPTVWLWSRVGGDVVDLSLLGLTALRNPERRGRALAAIGNVLPIAVADVAATRRLAARTRPVSKGRLIRKAVTISAPRDRVESAWIAADEIRRNVDRARASVIIQNAPRDQGVELAVEFVEDPPLGDLGAAVAKLTGRDLAAKLADQLRRLKATIETGEVLRSDATPDGHLLPSHVNQRPAKPLEEVPA